MRHRPPHGGDLNRACREYGIPRSDWIDLSTGINPNGWPVPEIPGEIWRRLPEVPTSLLDVAAHYFGCQIDQLLPVAGSQAVIQTLPSIIQAPRVAVPDLGYAEHRAAWQSAGAQLIEYPAGADHKQLERVASQADLMLVINPNNPSGDRYSLTRLLSLSQVLAERGGWLLVDEAFIDMSPEHSLASTIRPNIIVLRSLGKFFGLAGARAGFVLGASPLLESIELALGPWSVSAPALYLAERALSDTAWQQQAAVRLHSEGERLYQLMKKCGQGPVRSGGLFTTLFTDQAPALHEGLALQGIWTRLLDNHQGVRLGLPANENQWQRLENALGDGSS
ncbi:threonine-phosphate decarboxylase CobD [Aestuariirhabdus sp. Z084]|uniref:threonine-phosphate decarboxylase CobD n=1 Tax=Aestuariirhabdus haliotis TaxID=2918751 RepID=UPI00201B3CAC|nr:threonine-phosphate decarboxylase CobD [Aestuariirhabdus haliotis]MCL6416806.1 threonine-phosphate decarboxylase CobD [Aestuariirhabdus haliotis]MCL6420806.1 threonine-phosphate decarboxylase CobD [Aestuariirhabdus haliotis]